jgi:hypothetical protein
MKLSSRFAAAVLAAGLLAAPAISVAQYPPPPPPRGAWDQPPSDFTRDLQRDAFRQGMDGARRDLENHRRPNVMNRDEFRNYRGPERRVWRNAFQRGYQAFWAHMGPGRPY